MRFAILELKVATLILACSRNFEKVALAMIVRHLELSPGTKTVKHLQRSIFHQSICQFFEMSLIKIDIFDILF